MSLSCSESVNVAQCWVILSQLSHTLSAGKTWACTFKKQGWLYKNMHIIKRLQWKTKRHAPFLVTLKYDTFDMSPPDSIWPTLVFSAKSPVKCYYVLSVLNYLWIMIFSFSPLFSVFFVSSTSLVWAACSFALGFLPDVSQHKWPPCFFFAWAPHTDKGYWKI